MPFIKKINKQFEYAEYKGIEYVIISGEDEIKSGNLTLKNLALRSQQSLTIAQIIETLK